MLKSKNTDSFKSKGVSMSWITKTVLPIVLIGSLSADVVFDLRAQQLSNSIAKNYKDSTYDVDSVIVSTGLAYIDGGYQAAENRAGSLGVQLKEPKTNWGVTYSFKCNVEKTGCGITLLGAKGKTLTISYEYTSPSYTNVIVNGTLRNRYDGTHHTISGSIQSQNGVITIDSNFSDSNVTLTKPDFALAKLSIQIANDTWGADQITDLNIATDPQSD